MNTPRILLLLLLTAGIIRMQAQDNATPAPATEPVQNEMQKWIATTDAQWQATFNREVVDAHAAELKKLAGQYAVSLDAALTKATAAGDLEGAVALRNEQKRFIDTNVFPEQDDAADAAPVKQIRAATRLQLARIEKENVIRTKALHTKYDAVLAQAQQQLTQAKRLDDALMVKAKREEVSASWLSAAPAAPATVAVAEKPEPRVPAAGANAILPDGQASGSVPIRELAKHLKPDQIEIAKGLHILSIGLPARRGLVYFHIDAQIDNQTPQARIEKQITVEARILCVGADGKPNVTKYSGGITIGASGLQSVGLGSTPMMTALKARNNGSEIPKNAHVLFKLGGVTFHEAFLSPPDADKWWLKENLVIK